MSQSLCFQGVLLRAALKGIGIDAASQSLCFQGVLLRRQFAKTSAGQRRLNPFVFRAYYCGVGKRTSGHRETVSIPLFSGRITAILTRQNAPGDSVSIPLFSGRITARLGQQNAAQMGGLNPFVFRAYYCASPAGDIAALLKSQSLCFQGVLLRGQRG